MSDEVEFSGPGFLPLSSLDDLQMTSWARQVAARSASLGYGRSWDDRRLRQWKPFRKALANGNFTQQLYCPGFQGRRERQVAHPDLHHVSGPASDVGVHVLSRVLMTQIDIILGADQPPGSELVQIRKLETEDCFSIRQLIQQDVALYVEHQEGHVDIVFIHLITCPTHTPDSKRVDNR